MTADAQAGREVTARVTKADIRAGQQFATDEANPLAIAVIRALGLVAGPAQTWHLRFGEDWWTLRDGVFSETHQMPPDQVAWLRVFDSGEPVPPFEFTFTTKWSPP